MWGGFQLFLGWFPRFVFVTAACADACVAVCFAAAGGACLAGAGAACFAAAAGGDVFEDWERLDTIRISSKRIMMKSNENENE